LYLRCINALECACSMIKVVRQGINPILNQYDYPELSVRIGIDVGENAVVQFGWDTYTSHGKVIMKRPHFDILGYTISIATKMTTHAKVNNIIVGQLIYDVLSKEEQEYFSLVDINPENWNYISDETGTIYKLYSNRA